MPTTDTQHYHVLLYSFPDMTTADWWMGMIDEARELDDRAVISKAIVQRDHKGQVHINEAGHGVAGGVVGAGTGTLLAMLGGPIGVVAMAVAGGVLGSVAGHFAGHALADADLEQVGKALPPNSSAIAILVEDSGLERVQKLMSGRDATFVSVAVSEELSGVVGASLAEQLEAGSMTTQSASTPT